MQTPRRRKWPGHVAVLALLGSGPAGGAEAPLAADRSVRMAVGAGYVASTHPHTEGLDAGAAFAVDLAGHLSPRWRIGLSYSFERYRWSDTTSTWDDRRLLFADETLFDQRLLVFVRLDPLGPGPVSPFLALGYGTGWSTPSVRRSACEELQPAGSAAEVGFGVDASVGEAIRVGLDWRVATPPGVERACDLGASLAEAPDPPDGTRNRLLLGVTFEDPF